MPTIINAIGGIIIRPLLAYPASYNDSGIILYPKSVPEPNNSLMNPIVIKMKEYPSPLPIPSKNDT